MKIYTNEDAAHEDSFMIMEALNGYEDDRAVEVVMVEKGYAIKIGDEYHSEPVQLSIVEEAAADCLEGGLSAKETETVMKVARKIQAKTGK